MRRPADPPQHVIKQLVLEGFQARGRAATVFNIRGLVEKRTRKRIPSTKMRAAIDELVGDGALRSVPAPFATVLKYYEVDPAYVPPASAEMDAVEARRVMKVAA